MHDIIRETLHLGTPTQKIRRDVILDAEMVPFNSNRIDEFWRLRRLIESTAVGVRAGFKPNQADSQESIGSLSSRLSENHHLGLVFFDVLLLDGESFLHVPYSRRRQCLESLITPIDGHILLANRYCIDMKAGLKEASWNLAQVFAQTIADHQEGLVLKASDSTYNQWDKKWVKLKKDYIPGYGDTLDLVLLGASWDKERSRNLRAPASTFTTFYIGILDNTEEIKQDPGIIPRFHIYCTVSWGPDREDLEELNFLLEYSDHVHYNELQRSSTGICSVISRETQQVSYHFSLLTSLPQPRILLCNPLLTEILGAGFTKAKGSKHYELRFPRIVKWYRSKERSWKDAVDAPTLHRIARESVGRDRTNKDVDDWCNDIWGLPVSPGVRSPRKRKVVAEMWEDNLVALDQSSFPRTPKRLRPLGSMTNVVQARSAESSGSNLSNQPMPSNPEKPLRFNSEMQKFFDESFVCFSMPSGDLPAWKHQIPRDHETVSVECFLTDCGWHADAEREHASTPAWLKRGLLFVNTCTVEGRGCEAHVVGLIQRRMADMVHLQNARRWRKQLLIFDSLTFNCDGEHIAGQAVHSFQ